jgi:hypothetical protein
VRVAFADEQSFEMAAALLAQAGQAAAFSVDRDARQVEVDDGDLLAMVERIAAGQPVALPEFGTDADRWTLLAGNERDAGLAFAHLRSFLLPTYVALPEAGVAVLERADALPFPVAPPYRWAYRWEAPPAHRRLILQRLRTWATLEGRRPELELPEQAGYAELLARFKSALAAADWVGAEATLAEMRKLHLCTAENLAYLRVQLLAAQGRWRAIWEDDAYPWLARLPVPRVVRSALITAFHQVNLLVPESTGDLGAALERYREKRGRLGSLAAARVDLSDSPVVRVFGYGAVVAGDRAALDVLLALPDLDAAARTCLEGLSALLPALPPVAPPPAALAPAQRLSRAMRERNYDAAVEAAQALESPADRAVALLRITARHQDAGRLALAAWEALTPDEQADAEALEPSLDHYLELALGPEPPPAPAIRDWAGWFARAVATPDDPALLPALDALAAETDERELGPDVARRLAGEIEALVADGAARLGHRTLRRGLEAVVDQVLSDRAFPRGQGDFRDLYQALYDSLVVQGDVTGPNCAKLLRLADAVLRVRPGQVVSVASDLKSWFDRPSPALEVFALDAVDLLFEFGVARGAIVGWYRAWVEHRLDLPPSVDWPRAHQEVWLVLGAWLQPGEDLLGPLRGRLRETVAEAEEDPLTRLPAGYRIGIFTLQRSSAERARGILLGRNAGLDIRLCLETDMSPSVEAIARNSDAAVVVTTCLTHSIYYGISPLLARDPIYPDARGSASIIRAVEAFARTF